MKENDMRLLIAERTHETSQRKFAKEIGVSPQYISQILDGQRHISAEVAAKLGYKLIVTKTVTREYVKK